MKYAILVYTTPDSYDQLGEQERAAVTGEYMSLAQDPRCVESAQLQPVESATTIRVQDGRTLTTDGPFADTKEFFGGYYIFEAADLDEAIGVAAKIPSARMGGSAEVRPVVERPS
jgi:hypothetical protein